MTAEPILEEQSESLAAPASRTLFLNSFFSVAARGLAGLARVIVLLGIARRYGPEQFGKVALAVSVMEVFRTLSEFGIDTIAIRRFTNVAGEKLQDTLAKVMGAKIVLASVSYCLCLISLLALGKGSGTIVFGAAVGLSLFSANLVGASCSYLQTRFAMRQFLVTTVTSVVLYVGLCWIAITGGAALPMVLLLLPFSEVVNVLLLWRREHRNLKIRFDRIFTVKLLSESLPVGFMAGMIILYFRLDNVLIFNMAGEKALGLYAVAYRLIEPALMIPHAFSLTLYALLTRRHTGSAVSMVFRTMWPAYVAIACGVGACFGLGQRLLATLSPEYLNTYPVLRVLATTLLIRTANITLTAILNSKVQYRRLAVITATNLFVNFALVVVLLRHFGIIGAAYAALGTETWNFAAQMWSVARLSSVEVERQSTALDLRYEQGVE